MSKIKANDALVKALSNWGIDHVYGIPGDTIDTVVDALKSAKDKIKFYQVRHEEVASLAARSYAKLTGKIVFDEMLGYAKFEIRNLLEENKLTKMPPLKTIMRRIL